MLNHAAINIKGRQSTPLAANTNSSALEEGVYDVYAVSALTYIRVGEEPAAADSTHDYPIPSGGTVTVLIPEGCKIRASSAIILYRVD
ncbi:hypothetical protein EVB68_038 [Rhizobium phage RHph_Y2_6]|uniref:Uncharacterized protein n=2 Tax=Acanvirus TaxID=3044653 RepID=A0AAE7VM60_9CAUD|nr:hypothetical protein PP748_gp038 [Rhizobium phage RHph_Y2_6]YP_010658344.1 hypothetical protein PP750_gp34 [Rhizobium phage RHEph16]QIG68775.1 hypothetical protein EVB68_038 [Rhizobium phage RHph_Y2_6]QXV74343.1 hypothetical protein [Rhizobium phage RHEph16]